MRSWNPSGYRYHSVAATEESRALPSCGVKQKPTTVRPIAHRQGLHRHHRLVQDAPEVAVVAPEGEDPVGGAFPGQGDPGVGLQALHHLLDGDVPVEREAELEHVHVLAVEHDRRGPQGQVVAEGGEDAVGVAGVVGAEAGVVVAAHRGAGHELAVLADVVGPAHADEAPVEQVRGLPVEADRADQHRDVVGVAGDDLQEPVLAADQGLVVDARGRTSSRSRTPSPGP